MSSEKILCRLCLGQSVIHNSLLEKNGTEMVFALTGIKISEDDILPTVACVKCWTDLNSAYEIQQRFIEVGQKLSDFSSTKNLHFEIFEPEIISEERVEAQVDVLKDEEQHTCPICGFGFDTNIDLYSHIATHYSSEQKCDKCNESFENIAAYKDHSCMKNSTDIWPCNRCPLKFQYKPLFDLHIAKLHSKSISDSRNDFSNDPALMFFKRRFKRPVKVKVKSESDDDDDNFQCPECGKVCFDKKTFKAHCKNHERVNCPICSRAITKYNLSKHINSHTEDKRICHLCGATCKNSESLRGHIYHTHSKNTFACSICGKVFKKAYTRNLHVKKDHTFQKDNVCDQCGKSFYTKYSLNKHVKMTHLKLRPFECKYCLKGFSSRFAMVTHIRQHTNEAPYKCSICGEGFRQNVSLRAHRKSKHLIVEVKKVKCKICSKSFVDDWALNSHISRLHS